MSRFTRDEAIQLKAKFALANLMRSRRSVYPQKKFQKTQNLIADTAIHSPWSDSIL